mmetsp:Transcript_2395/g.3634  ORF Transcript_2395/g.3634 Transcript_2395/m.3634 type:complete len:260 (+) Transcript_2395:3567-4346(+)
MPNELFKQKLSIGWTTTGFGVKLDAEKRFVDMDNTLICQIIGVEEERLPSFWKRVSIHCKTMILWCDVAPACTQIYSRLVHTTVSVLQFVSLRTSSKSKKLVPQTNTKNRARWLQFERILDRFDSCGAHRGITRTVGKEKTLPLNVARIGFEVIIERNYVQFHFVDFNKITDNVVFHTAIICNYFAGVPGTVDLYFFQGYLGHKITLVRVIVFNQRRRQFFLWIRLDLSKERTVFTELHCKSPSVHTVNSWNLVLGEPL